MLELLMLNTGQLLLNTVTVLACHVQVEGPGSFLIVHVTAQTAADVRELLIMALTGEPVLYGRAVAEWTICVLLLPNLGNLHSLHSLFLVFKTPP